MAALVVLLGLSLFGGKSHAQATDYPRKPVTLGGRSRQVAFPTCWRARWRSALEPAASRCWSKQGRRRHLIAGEYVAKAARRLHALAPGHVTHAVNVGLYKKLPTIPSRISRRSRWSLDPADAGRPSLVAVKNLADFVSGQKQKGLAGLRVVRQRHHPHLTRRVHNGLLGIEAVMFLQGQCGSRPGGAGRRRRLQFFDHAAGTVAGARGASVALGVSTSSAWCRGPMCRPLPKADFRASSSCCTAAFWVPRACPAPWSTGSMPNSPRPWQPEMRQSMPP